MARFDLNLLSALDALLSEKNVTRAAERLNVTQPTMSGMLQRLRYQFDDQLLVRNGRNMELTPFGESLAEPVREALRGVEMLMLAEPVFDPATSTREFRLMASDYCTSIFLPGVIARMSLAAPGVRLSIQPIDTPIAQMVSGSVDLCITADDLSLYGPEGAEEKIHADPLFSDEFVCIVADDHPLGDCADLNELLSYPHIGVEMAGTVGTLESVALREYAPSYKPSVVVAEFSLIPPMVANSQLVGIIQSRLCSRAMRTLPIRTLNLPCRMPTLNETMLWHSRHLQDPAHAWLRGLIRQVAGEWREVRPKADALEPGPPKRPKSPLAVVH